MAERFDRTKKYDVVAVCGEPFLCTYSRVERSSIPEGLYVYDVGDRDSDSCFARISPHVAAGYLATIMGKHPILFWDGDDDPKLSYPEYGTNHLGSMTYGEYMATDTGSFGITTKSAEPSDECVVLPGKNVQEHILPESGGNSMVKGRLLRQMRFLYGYSAEEMCRKLDISKSYLSALEHNEKTGSTPSTDLMRRYAEAFGIRLSALLMLNEEYPGEEAFAKSIIRCITSEIWENTRKGGQK